MRVRVPEPNVDDLGLVSDVVVFAGTTKAYIAVHCFPEKSVIVAVCKGDQDIEKLVGPTASPLTTHSVSLAVQAHTRQC